MAYSRRRRYNSRSRRRAPSKRRTYSRSSRRGFSRRSGASTLRIVLEQPMGQPGSAHVVQEKRRTF